MSSTLSRKARAPRELTAQPRSLDAEIARRRRRESGISVDADELGPQFLADAIEQSDFETVSGATPELFVTSGPPHDEPLTGPNFDPENTIWDQTVALGLQESDARLAAPSGNRPASGLEKSDEDADNEDLFDDVSHVIGAFDDDERWREVARTGRAL